MNPKRSRYRLFMILSAFVTLTHFATSSAQALQDAETRIARLIDRLRYRENDPADKARVEAERGRLTDQIRTEIDNYLQGGSDLPTLAFSEIQARIGALLASQQASPEYTGPAFASAKELRNGKSLVVAYPIVRPPHFDVGAIRGYRAVQGRFRLITTTPAGDFDGHGMFVSELASPMSGELWVLVWGQAFTFNGTKVRFRLYSFNGATFKTVWGLDDAFSAKLTLGSDRFSIDRIRYNPYQRIREEYELTSVGVVTASTRVLFSQ